MKKILYCILIFYFLSPPCFGHFTQDIVSYTMSVHLYNTLQERQTLWESRQADHLTSFKEQKEAEINNALNRKKETLDRLSNALHDIKDTLNARMRSYNALQSQLESVEQEQQRAQEEYNQTIQKIREREALERRIVSLVEEINVLVRVVNEEIHQLRDLEVQEQTLKRFYENREYLKHNSIVQFEMEWRRWQQRKNEEYKAQAMNYNNKVGEFQNWERDQQISIRQQRSQITKKQDQVNESVRAANVLVSEYNAGIEQGCQTKKCEDELSEKRGQITRKKTEVKEQEIVIRSLMSALNEQEDSYNKEHQRRVTELNVLRQSFDTFLQDLSRERTQYTQRGEEVIRIQQEPAQEKWRQAQEQLNQFQAILKINYGGPFPEFVEQLSHWKAVNQVAFTNLAAKALSQQDIERMQISNSSLCADHVDMLATRVKEVCILTKRVANLLGNISYFDVVLDDQTEVLKQKKQEIADIRQKLNTLDSENKRLQSQFDTQLKEHKEQHSERQGEHIHFAAQLRAQLVEQMNQIQEAYNRKYRLLDAEYALISYLFVPNNKQEQGVLNEKWNDFKSAHREFLSNIPRNITSFSEEFMQTNELMLDILKQDNWSMDISIVSLSSTSNGRGIEDIRLMEEEEKRQVVFSWMNTQEISHFLDVMTDRISELDSNRVLSSSTLFSRFVERIFLESVYQATPIQQVVDNNHIRYQITDNNNVFWVLPKGWLSRSNRGYQ